MQFYQVLTFYLILDSSFVLLGAVRPLVLKDFCMVDIPRKQSEQIQRLQASNQRLLRIVEMHGHRPLA